MGFLIRWSIFGLFTALLIYIYNDVKNFELNVVRLTPVKEFVGELAPKQFIGNVEYILRDRIHGPECFVIRGDAVYTGTSHGELVKIVNDRIVKKITVFDDNPTCKLLKCSRPLGMRYWKDEKIVYADAKLGLFVADFETGTIKQIFSSKTYLGQWGNMFPDDLAFIDHETVIMTDMSGKCGEEKFALCFLEYTPDGSLIQINLNTGKWEVIAKDLISPNGILQHPDKDSVLVAQTILSRIIRVYYKGPKKGQYEVFADGLPGIVDNLRESHNGNSFWIGMPVGANQKWRPLTQLLAEYPSIRRLLAYLPEVLRHVTMAIFAPRYNVLIEMDFNGNIIQSIHDPENLLDFYTHIEDTGTHLYIGSYVRNVIRRIRKP